MAAAGAEGAGAAGRGGGAASYSGVEQAATPRIAAAIAVRRDVAGVRTMWVILLEALAALALLVFIVWWTMFSGRRRGEPRDAEHADDDSR
jgi:cyanate permease